MSQRTNACFNCGSQDHYARECPTSIWQLIKKRKWGPLEETHASTAERLDISQGSVRSHRGKDPEETTDLRGLRDLRGTTGQRGVTGLRGLRGENALRERRTNREEEIAMTTDPSATTARRRATSQETAKMRRGLSATTARRKATSPEIAPKEKRREISSATTAMRSATLPEPAPTRRTRNSDINLFSHWPLLSPSHVYRMLSHD